MRPLTLVLLLLFLTAAWARRSFAPPPTRTPPVKLAAAFTAVGGLAAGWGVTGTPGGTPVPTPLTVEEESWQEEASHHPTPSQVEHEADLDLDEGTLVAVAQEWHARGVDGEKQLHLSHIAPPPPRLGGGGRRVGGGASGERPRGGQRVLRVKGVSA